MVKDYKKTEEWEKNIESLKRRGWDPKEFGFNDAGILNMGLMSRILEKLEK